MSESTITLNNVAVVSIRHALIIGLSSYGEIERLCNYAEMMKQIGEPLPECAVPLHPTGTDETIGPFADALAYLNV